MNRAPIGEVRLWLDKNGAQRAMVKVKQPNHWKARAQIEWERVNGPIPHGLILHHKNRDTIDDAIDNLCLVSRAEHMNEHRREFKRIYKRGDQHPARLHPERMARGERHGCAKLTEAAVREIRAAIGIPHRTTARQHGVSVATIKGIRQGRSWRHVV